MSKPITLQDGTGVIAYNGQNQPLLMVGPTQPTDGAPGYAPGCLFIKTDGTHWWNNANNATSANFDQISLP